MWMMLQQDKPEDFVLATGKTTSVRDFVKMSFREIGVELEFKGEGRDEIGVVTSSTNEYLKVEQTVVSVDPKYFRPTEVDLLIGNPTKANKKLGWTPKYDLQALCSEMVRADIELFKKDELLKKAGFQVKNEFE
jgi:GDPmannose 4,6-dehydratase